MAMIYVATLDADMRRAIKNKRFSDEEVCQLNEQFQEKWRKQIKAFVVCMTIVSVMVIGLGSYTMIKAAGLPDALPYILFYVLALIFIGVVTWFFSIGITKMQWKSLIRKYYPDVFYLHVL